MKRTKKPAPPAVQAEKTYLKDLEELIDRARRDWPQHVVVPSTVLEDAIFTFAACRCFAVTNTMKGIDLPANWGEIMLAATTGLRTALWDEGLRGEAYTAGLERAVWLAAAMIEATPRPTVIHRVTT